MALKPSDLQVVAVMNNPVGYTSRVSLMQQFIASMRTAKVSLTLVEAELYSAPFKVTQANRVGQLQLRQVDEIWQKENMVNAGARALPNSWEYIAWIDGDVSFINSNWAMETLQQLQVYEVVQLFQTACDLGPKNEVFNTYNGFGYSFATGQPKFTVSTSAYYGTKTTGKYWHPGYAWAMNRETYEKLGGLLEVGVLGSGDHHMALSYIGDANESIPTGLNANYVAQVMQWQERAKTAVRADLGYVSGTLMHYWHGNKGARNYWGRWDILKKWNFDPAADVYHDPNGLWRFTAPGDRMRNDFRRYFRNRNEDSVDLN
jgi:hypothetical protein